MEVRDNDRPLTMEAEATPDLANWPAETTPRNRAIVRQRAERSPDLIAQNRAIRRDFSGSIESLSLIGQVYGGEGGIRTHVTA